MTDPYANITDQALTVGCPECEVPAGHRCMPLRGVIVHAARVQLWRSEFPHQGEREAPARPPYLGCCEHPCHDSDDGRGPGDFFLIRYPDPGDDHSVFACPDHGPRLTSMGSVAAAEISTLAEIIAVNDQDHQLTYGGLHIVIGDENLEADSIRWCLNQETKPCTALERQIGERMLALDIFERWMLMQLVEKRWRAISYAQTRKKLT